ncbi:unnamed protein product [Didymodactylos carnosus]|uniref:Uncharacterized protein n=1 Tax=Didymodactylos carnosus TaxID=1234261 RepID=A0A8S2IPZ7_9BILA|nr:unnamed protein product [Didymodactylos carnosus]CAF3750486.1 unnamed protein product [Didymodactylos carnosus]
MQTNIRALRQQRQQRQQEIREARQQRREEQQQRKQEIREERQQRREEQQQREQEIREERQQREQEIREEQQQRERDIREERQQRREEQQQREQEIQEEQQQREREIREERQQRREEQQQREREIREERQQRREEQQQREQEIREEQQQREQEVWKGRQQLRHETRRIDPQPELDVREIEQTLKLFEAPRRVEPETFFFQSARQKQPSAKCPLLLLTCEWVQSLNWPPSLFNSAFDRCYCKHCYPAHWNDVELVAGCKYVIPRGWVRVGLHADQSFAEIHQIWSKWIVCYHGTCKMAALSILSHHHFYLPGDMLMDGTVLGIRAGHIPGKKHIYTSPTIAYSSLPAYSPIYDFHSRTTRNDYHVQLVLQCRQNPGTFHVQAETVGNGSQRICPHIPNDIIEHYTEIRSSIVAYGLLVRIKEQNNY